MNILVIGSGGREHALVWKLAQSPRVASLYCAPGNPGIGRQARCLPIAVDDLAGLETFVREQKINLTIVGPELPLTLGIADRFRASGLRVVGATRRAAEIESSKAFAKAFMERNGIPTARSKIFDRPEPARAYVREHGAPIVVKADGLAAGKGVIVAMTEDEAVRAVDEIMGRKRFGEAGSRIVIEEFLKGEEVSLLAFTDGRAVVPMVPVQDHKTVYDGDRGPNTGGMGTYSPVSALNEAGAASVTEKILRPVVEGLAREGRPYQGVLYAGLMMTEEGPRVLEFNARFGDPETQVILSRLESDLAGILEAIADGTLERATVRWSPRAAVCVVIAAKGYPGDHEMGREIAGLDEAGAEKDVAVFHAGTALSGGRLVTAGGRVLGVTALGDDLARARAAAYAAVGRIRFEGMHFRTDIGLKDLREREGAA